MKRLLIVLGLCVFFITLVVVSEDATAKKKRSKKGKQAQEQIIEQDIGQKTEIIRSYAKKPSKKTSATTRSKKAAVKKSPPKKSVSAKKPAVVKAAADNAQVLNTPKKVDEGIQASQKTENSNSNQGEDSTADRLVDSFLTESANQEKTEGLVKKESEVIQSSDFPEKTSFIAKEDQKNNQSADPFAGVAKDMKDEGSSVFEGMILKVVLGTVGIGVVLFLLGGLWQWIQRKSVSQTKKNGLTILSQQLITSKARVAVVETHKKKFLIGVTENSIQLLADLDFYQDDEGDFEKPPISLSSQATITSENSNKKTKKEKVEEAKTPFDRLPEEQVVNPVEMPASESLDYSGALRRVQNKVKNLKKIV